MAVLKPTLTLTGTQADLGATLSLSETPTGDSLTVKHPMQGVSKINITTAVDQEVIDADYSDPVHVYIKNTDTSNFVKLIIGGTVTDWGRVGPGDFAFFTLKPSSGLEVQADTAACEIEYAYWSKG
jgi:hypothetical protein